MLLDVWGVIIDFMNHDSLVNPLLLWWLHFPSSLHHHLSPSSSPWWYFLPPTQERDFSALAPAQAAAELLRTGDFQELPRLFNIAGRSCYVQWDVCPSFAPCCSEYGYCRTKVCLKYEPFGWKKERKKVDLRKSPFYLLDHPSAVSFIQLGIIFKIFLLSKIFFLSLLVCRGLAVEMIVPIFGQVEEERRLQKVKVLSKSLIFLIV